jgi:hypothetical protein
MSRKVRPNEVATRSFTWTAKRGRESFRALGFAEYPQTRDVEARRGDWTVLTTGPGPDGEPLSVDQRHPL